MSVLGAAGVDTSVQLGSATVKGPATVAMRTPIGAVIQSVFFCSIGLTKFEKPPSSVIELACQCGVDVACDHCRSRTGTQHADQFDHDRTQSECRNDEVAQAVDGPRPLLEVDTDPPADITAVVRFVDAHRPVEGTAP